MRAGHTDIIQKHSYREHTHQPLLSWCQTLFITPGRPWENGYIESLNNKLEEEYTDED